MQREAALEKGGEIRRLSPSKKNFQSLIFRYVMTGKYFKLVFIPKPT
jgi:hypothetical protein